MMVVGSAPRSHNPFHACPPHPHAGPPPVTGSRPLLAGAAPSVPKWQSGHSHHAGGHLASAPACGEEKPSTGNGYRDGGRAAGATWN